VLYGRRRIGKTALIEEFAKGKKDLIYFLADQQTQTQQIESLKAARSMNILMTISCKRPALTIGTSFSVI